MKLPVFVCKYRTKESAKGLTKTPSIKCSSALSFNMLPFEVVFIDSYYKAL